MIWDDKSFELVSEDMYLGKSLALKFTENNFFVVALTPSGVLRYDSMDECGFVPDGNSGESRIRILRGDAFDFLSDSVRSKCYERVVSERTYNHKEYCLFKHPQRDLLILGTFDMSWVLLSIEPRGIGRFMGVGAFLGFPVNSYGQLQIRR